MPTGSAEVDRAGHRGDLVVIDDGEHVPAGWNQATPGWSLYLELPAALGDGQIDHTRPGEDFTHANPKPGYASVTC